MATLYLWRAQSGFGVKRNAHISLKLSTGLYISVRYTIADILNLLTTEHFNIVGVEAGPRTLDEDVDFRGRNPDTQFEIPADYLDRDKIKEFWEMQKNWSDTCISDSCAGIVQQAVIYGSTFPVTEIIEPTDPDEVYYQIKQDYLDAIRSREGSPSLFDTRFF